MNWLQSLALKVLIAAALLCAVWTAGFMGGKQAGRMDQLTDTVEAFRTRGNIDATVRGKSDFDLCIAAGGLPEQCNELRGLGTAAKGE